MIASHIHPDCAAVFRFGVAAFVAVLGIPARAQSQTDAISISSSGVTTTTVAPGNAFGWGVGVFDPALIAESGRRELTFQWFKDGAPIGGANMGTYARPAAEPEASGTYFLRVISPTLGAIDSKPVTVTVVGTPAAPSFGEFALFSSPAGLAPTIQIGTRCALAAPALESGTGPFTYQWSKDGAVLPGETRAALFRAAWSTADSGSYRVTISNSLGSVTSAPWIQGVTLEERWEWAAPLPQGNPLRNVTWLNGRFLASGERGTLLDSSDGLGWQLRRLGGSATIGSIAYGNGAYVALATAGGLFTSDDTVTWTPRESGLTDGRTLVRVAYGGGRFVAVGTRGTLLVSTDGVAWQTVNAGTTEDLSAVAFGNGRWLASTAISNSQPAMSPRILSSDDGITWVTRSFTPEPSAHLAFGNGVFAVAPAGFGQSFYTSPDGTTWTRSPSSAPLIPIVSFQHTGAGFLGAVPFAPSSIGPAYDGQYLGPSDGSRWFVRGFQPPPLSRPTDLAFGNGRFVMTGGGSDPLRTSTDGVAWSTPGPVDSRTILAIAASATTAVAVGGELSRIPQPARVNTSFDGTTWFTRQTSVNAQLMDVAYGAGVANTFVAVGATSEGGSVIACSPDGNTWTVRHSIAKNDALGGVSYVNGRFFAVGNNTMFSSLDGISWSSVRVPPAPYLSRVAYGAGVYVAVGQGGVLLRSTDAITWASQPTDLVSNGNASWFSDVIYAAGKFVAVTAFHSADRSVERIATSPDGLVWTTRWTDPAFLGRVFFAGNRFICLRFGNSGYLVSNDGETWSLTSHGNKPGMLAIAAFKNRVILAGESGAILTQLLPPPAGSSLPVVTTKPADQNARTGQGVTFSVAAVSSPAPTFQWLKNGTPIPGATNASLALAALQFADAGSYACVVSTPAGAVTTTLSLNVAPAAQLSNLSVRTTLAPAQNLVVGLTVGGLDGAKPVLVRAAGPALAALGVAGAASDPKLELYADGRKILENDDWSPPLAADFVKTGAFAFPASSKDAAILRLLSGSVSAVASATGSGVLLLESYDADLDSVTSARLTNLSARYHVGTGADVLIAGLNVAGTGTLRVLIRGAGPGLTAFGISGALRDPKIEVFNSAGGKIDENDNWSATLASTFAGVGAFPLTTGSRDAALIVSLPAGRGYTVQVSGVNGATGEALVELYELP